MEYTCKRNSPNARSTLAKLQFHVSNLGRFWAFRIKIWFNNHKSTSVGVTDYGTIESLLNERTTWDLGRKELEAIPSWPVCFITSLSWHFKWPLHVAPVGVTLGEKPFTSCVHSMQHEAFNRPKEIENRHLWEDLQPIVHESAEWGPIIPLPFPQGQFVTICPVVGLRGAGGGMSI